MLQRLLATAAFAVFLVGHAPDTRAAEPAPATQKPVAPPQVTDARGGINDSALDARVEDLLRKMTLEEKVGQLVQYSSGQPTGPGTGRTDYADMIAKGQIGAMFNVATAKETNQYQRLAVGKSRLGIPIVFGLDVIHGFRTVFPVPLALASTWDPALVEQAARVAAREASATGVRWTFSPMVDIARDARWGRMTEGNGEDPYLGSVMAVAYVRGYQGTRLDAPDSVAATAKHFVGYGAAEGGRDYNSTEISEHTLRQVYLPPFRASVDAGAASIMSAFNSLNGVPTSANPFTLRQILRDEWGFRGVVDSDWESVRELIHHGIANDRETAALKGFMGGVDMDMVSSVYHDHLAGLVRAGKVPQSRIDESVRYVLRMKFALGLFEKPYADEARERKAMLQPESLALAKKAAERSFVLLKNEPAQGRPLLPLEARTGRIALIGPLADDLPSSLGAWAGQGKAEDVVSLHAALAKRLGDRNLVHHKGVGVTGGSDEDLAAAVSAAGTADVVILALGESSQTMTGEAASRAFLGLPGRQQELLEKIVATGKPVVLVLFSGRPLTLPWAFEKVPAVLAVWQPGVQTGPAIVSTLFGESNPVGKLVVSWPRSVGQLPLYYNALNTGRPANKNDLTKPTGPADDKYVSKYIDERNDPQFPFGYGLSYTRFQYGSVQVSGEKLSAAELTKGLDARAGGKTVMTASADVTNSGSRAGEEVVQLYVRLMGTSTSQPVRALQGFQRVSLAPGETRKVTFELTPQTFALWSDQQKWVVEAANVAVYVSADSAQGSPMVFEISP